MGGMAWPLGRSGGHDGKLVLQRQERLFAMALEGNEELTDVTFVLKDSGWQFRGHKWVMCTGSTFLLACFSSGMKEAKEGIVWVEGCSREVFLAIAEFLYCGGVGDDRLSGVDGGKLLEFGAMWGVEGLREWVVRGLDEGSVCGALNTGVDDGDEELVAACLGVVGRVGIGALGAEGLRGLGAEALERALLLGPEGRGDQGLMLVERWWEANVGEAGGVTAEDCRRLALHLDVGELSSEALRRVAGKAWLLAEGAAEAALEGRMCGGEGWGRHATLIVKGDRELLRGGALGQDCRARHVGIFDDGAFCVANEGGQVAVYGADGAWERALGGGELRCVRGLCVRPGTDTVYALHEDEEAERPEGHHVAIYRRNGERVGDFGRWGERPGGGNARLFCVAAGRAGDVYVGGQVFKRAERNTVQLYAADGTFVRVFLHAHDVNMFGMMRPAGVAVSPRDGSVAIVDTIGPGGGKVHVLSAQGQVLRALAEGAAPVGVCVSLGGDFVVAAGRGVRLFGPEGAPLQDVDARVTTAPLRGPVALLGVAVSGGELFAWYGAARIRVLGPSDQPPEPG